MDKRDLSYAENLVIWNHGSYSLLMYAQVLDQLEIDQCTHGIKVRRYCLRLGASLQVLG